MVQNGQQHPDGLDDDVDDTPPNALDSATALLDDMENNPDAYPDIEPLPKRGSTAVQLRRDGATDEELYRKYSYSRVLAQLSEHTKKPFGYQRDAHVVDPEEKLAVLGSHALADLFLDADCVNREGRWRTEEARARQWQRLMSASPRPEGAPDIDDLLNRWSAADAFCQQALIEELKYGIDATLHLDDQWEQRDEERRQVEMEASRLPAAENMFFRCRLLQYQIMRERTFDLAMGWPTADYTDLKEKLADGGDIHDHIMGMIWAFKEGYQRIEGSMMDGESHRMQMIAMNAQQVPQPQWPMMPYGMPAAPGQPMMQPAQPGQPAQPEPEQPPDTRKAFFSFGQKQQPQQQTPQRRRARSRATRG